MDLAENGVLLIGLCGVLAIASSVFGFVMTERFRETATRARGRVTEMVYSPGVGTTGRTYAPRFEYKTSDGKLWSILSTNGSTPAAFKVGDEITVLYNPQHPADAEIDSVTQLWALPTILGIIGLIASGLWLRWFLDVPH